MSSILKQRDYAILRHVARYRLTTREALHRALFSHVAINAVTKVTSRLMAEGWLEQYPAFYKSFYFTLTPQAAELLETPYAAGVGPLSAKGLAREYGMLGFCCLLSKPRCRLLASEVQEEYPALCFANLDCDRYYLNATRRPTTYGIMAVDDGSAAEQVVAGCHADLRARCNRPGFRELLAEGRFRLTLITATQARAADLAKCVGRKEWPCRHCTTLEIVSKLTYCLSLSQAARPE